MALGGLVFGGLAVVPALAFGAYKSYKEANRIEAESEKVTRAAEANRENAQKIRKLVPKVDSLTNWTVERNSAFSAHLQVYRNRAIEMANEIALLANSFAEDLSAQSKAASAGT